MEWIRRAFEFQVRESHVGKVLIFCLIAMSAMTIALVWQAQVIADQRESIRWLEQLKFGG
jgi:hypothetical protein